MSYVVANWKMHAPALKSWLKEVAAAVPRDVQAILCPPSLYIDSAVQLCQSIPLAVGAQNCHDQQEGAFTGEISASMLKGLGARFVILGHSERRQQHGETDAQVKACAQAALRHGLTPIICIGETHAERESAQTEAVIVSQCQQSVPDKASYLDANLPCIIAYEPVWAIGTGHTPAAEDIAQAHAKIKKILAMPAAVLYGGSVNGQNAADILSIDGVDGVLVGSASLKPESFARIVQASGQDQQPSQSFGS